jgi:hypothetical protein
MTSRPRGSALGWCDARSRPLVEDDQNGGAGVFGEEAKVVGELTTTPTTTKMAESRVMREFRKKKSHGRTEEIGALARALLFFILRVIMPGPTHTKQNSG